MRVKFLNTLNENFSIKLFVLFVFFVFIVFFSFTAVFIHLEGKSLNNSLISDGKLLAKILAQNTRIGVFSENEELLKDPVESIFQKEDILDISIYNQHGVLLKNKVRAGSNAPGKPEKDAVSDINEILEQLRISGLVINYDEHGNLKFYAPVISRLDNSLNGTAFAEEPLLREKDRFIGYVQITIGKNKLNKQLNTLLRRSVVIAILFFIAGAIVIFLIMKRLAKPLDRLTVAVKNVAAGKEVDKVHVETKDEIGKLANAFNTMAESIRLREKALRKSEEKYRALFEEARDVIFIIDSCNRFIDVNKQALDLFGYSREEILATGLETLFIQPDDLTQIKKAIGSEEYVRDTEVKLRKKDATHLDCLLTLSIRRSDNGEILGYQGIIRDVTHQKILEIQLQQAQRMESIGTLAGGIAHDFNNILSPIILHSEIAMDDLPPDHHLQLSIKEIYKAADRAKDLVKQILTFARKRDEEKILIKASLIIKEVINFLRSTIPTTIDIRYSNKTETDTIFADPTQLNRIVMNLCTNAAYAMREKGGILEVHIENEEIPDERQNGLFILRPGRYLKLTVRDNGTGIPPEVIDRIFDPYFTTKKFGEGTGLGLSTIHGIIKNYGGSITVKSAVGKGTTFCIYLPTVDAVDTGADSIKSDIPKGSEHILIVDDEKAAVDSMGETLERLGYKTTALTSSIEALETFRNNPEIFDLVITDMTMPKMTGKELVTELKLLRHDIPIILCTGFSEQINREIAKELGIDVFIMKPIIREKIANSIREVLDKKHSK
ncbi:MAG: response regulator [Deltaproteobacteria bacterium]|nr:response regulator [Deltaproteobacteria bacterium]